MASTQVGSALPKLSFAKVAAMRAPALPASAQHRVEDKRSRPHESGVSQPAQTTVIRSPPTSPRTIDQAARKVGAHSPQDPVTAAIEGLSLVKDANATSNGVRSTQSGESLDDDQSHLSSSSLKQQSFDTKSMASVTTFAMDEKESIRPDDSASVRAVDDDEASNAPARDESSAPNPRNTLRPSTSGVTIAARRYHTLTLTNPPRFGDLPAPTIHNEIEEQPPPSEVSNEQQSDVQEPASSLPLAPDEKLLDALATPKDRLPLLQLEERFLALIATPSNQFLDLPPQNSFARLLAHKLADYYSLAHHINEDGTSIRVFRTPNHILPTPLHILAQSIPTGPLQPPSAATFRIMRRAGLGFRQGSAGASTPASSSAPSKATSEAGLETTSEEGLMSPMDGTPNKDKSKPTREEREAQYKAARERIFGDFQESVTSESASTGENSASMSRSSSSSGKKKSRKQKAPKDDTFEARSTYIPSYAPMHMPNMQAPFESQYAEQAYAGAYHAPNNGYGTNFNYGATPTQAYPGFDSSMAYGNLPNSYGLNNGQSYGPTESWPPAPTSAANGYYNYSSTPTTYQQTMSPMLPRANSQYLPQSTAGMPQPQNWMNNQYQAPYPQPQSPVTPNMSGWSAYSNNQPMNNQASYGYGQLPVQAFNGNPTASYGGQFSDPANARSLFNPQTRSFVPNNTNSRNGGRNNNGRKRTSPASGQNQVHGNNDLAPRSFHPDTAGLPQPTRGFERVTAASIPVPQQRIPVKEDSLQQKYGAPAHLPKKPPPSQALSSYDAEGIVPSGVTIPAIPPLTTQGVSTAPAVITDGASPE